MPIYLFDVNILIALLDPMHVHHNQAHNWFASKNFAAPKKNANSNTWATCAITESGVIRILSSPAYKELLLSPHGAAAILKRFLDSQANHIYWEKHPSLLNQDVFNLIGCQGYKQITDILLLGVCKFNAGVLATFDSSIPLRCVNDAEAGILLERIT